MSGKGTVDAMPAGTTSGTPQVLLGHHLKQLKLPTVLREYDRVAHECARGGVDHPRYLLRLVELELIDRERRVVERRMKQARFPATKSLDTFDFTAIPSLNKMLVLELARGEFKQSAGHGHAAVTVDAAEQNQAAAETDNPVDMSCVDPPTA